MEEQSTPVAPPVPMPRQSPMPKRQHNFPNLLDSNPPSGTMPQTTPEDPPSPKGKGSCPGIRCSSGAAQRHSAETQTW